MIGNRQIYAGTQGDFGIFIVEFVAARRLKRGLDQKSRKLPISKDLAHNGQNSLRFVPVRAF